MPAIDFLKCPANCTKAKKDKCEGKGMKRMYLKGKIKNLAQCDLSVCKGKITNMKGTLKALLGLTKQRHFSMLCCFVRG